MTPAQKRLWYCLTWLAVPALAISSAVAADSAKQSKRPQQPPQPPAAQADEAADAAASYWLGILVDPVDSLLKTHLRIEAGVVVGQVVPESPAAEAGIEVHDILLKFGQTPLEDVESLQNAVEQNQGKEAKLTLLRAGQEKTLAVTPKPRPADIAPPGPAHPGDWGRISDMLKRMERGEAGEDPLRLYFLQPGFVVPKELRQRRGDLFPTPPGALQIPEGTRITITRQHEGPAAITVERNGEKWEVIEGQLDRLPADLRPTVKSMLGGGRVYLFGPSPVIAPGDRPAPSANDEPAPGPGPRVEPTVPGVGTRHKDMEKQLEQMQRTLREHEQRIKQQIDEMREQLQKLGTSKT